MTRARNLLVLAAISSLFLAESVQAQETIAVLSGASGPYQAAFGGFTKDFAQPIPVFRLPEDKPPAGKGTRVVVAFGSEAALKHYSESAALVACLAPGLPANFSRDGGFASIDMKPSADVMLSRLRQVQPGLKRLAVLWNSAETSNYIKELKRAAAPLGMEIAAVRVASPDGIPDALRSQHGKADALWLAPDPVLVTPVVFQTIKQFSWDNTMPFYAPTAGLVAAGAAGAVSVGADEAGREAAGLARKALSGEPLPETIYPAKTQLTLNVQSAAKAGLVLTPEVLSQADKVIR